MRWFLSFRFHYGKGCFPECWKVNWLEDRIVYVSKEDDGFAGKVFKDKVCDLVMINLHFSREEIEWRTS